ncbi:hypothetical protein FN846DRAFT_1029593 [Sphaerosporella brunnea]|uniref:Glycoside hydrolase/deacetylase n=1 Tax=Sphaerosporella brunnea TaxID=1250544 RepID=A0A5J5EL32_9PEZI|nr:hypothetical protein FN846DRAFT_1029593 [Sphaerosporella brunnea]
MRVLEFTLALLLSALLSVGSSLSMAVEEARATLEGRDSPNGRCGAANNNYSCNSGSTKKCCSQYGWCGDTEGHCGSDIYSCTVDKTIALTFDDGPYLYTAGLLDILKQKGVKATFFITGNNLDKGAIDTTSSWSNLIRRIYNEGHQVGSHSWTHQDLSAISETNRRYEMIRNEQALLSILGRYPTYMRPPYISCNTACKNTMAAIGYHVIIWDLDTDDYNNITPQLIQNSKDRVTAALQEGWDSYLSIAHDIHYQTVYNLTAFQIDAGKAAGYTHVRLGECLGDPELNWYRTAL